MVLLFNFTVLQFICINFFVHNSVFRVELYNAGFRDSFFCFYDINDAVFL